ncbi:hypothetical protein [Burkholderia vietnamiensis]|uniref:hypothetical protein n=1 Tax=Burkholderia vietnamiensis TaxID=60552 RepID=UPI00158BAB6F|nr:hypothetical protein [Burkholderia vietnamiensis]
MLSETVLEELLRDTPMRERLVREAWQDLSTESRLQVIQALGAGVPPGVPDWLCRLALDDKATIVRYWAARLAHFRGPSPEGVRPDLAPLYVRTEVQAQLYEQANADSSELVRTCAAAGGTLSYRTLVSASQFQRLVFLRTLPFPSCGDFFDWLGAAIDEGVPDLELADCMREFVALPSVRAELGQNPLDFDDGLDAHVAGKSVKAGWDVARSAGPALQLQLAFVLPTRMGLTTITADELATMPETVLAALPWRARESEEIARLVAMMHEHPEQFPDTAIKAAGRADRMTTRSGDDNLNACAKQAVDRPRATLEAVIRLDEKLTALGDQMQQMRVQASRKRGFFG